MSAVFKPISQLYATSTSELYFLKCYQNGQIHGHVTVLVFQCSAISQYTYATPTKSSCECDANLKSYPLHYVYFDIDPQKCEPLGFQVLRVNIRVPSSAPVLRAQWSASPSATATHNHRSASATDLEPTNPRTAPLPPPPQVERMLPHPAYGMKGVHFCAVWRAGSFEAQANDIP